MNGPLTTKKLTFPIFFCSNFFNTKKQVVTCEYYNHHLSHYFICFVFNKKKTQVLQKYTYLFHHKQNNWEYYCFISETHRHTDTQTHRHTDTQTVVTLFLKLRPKQKGRTANPKITLYICMRCFGKHTKK